MTVRTTVRLSEERQERVRLMADAQYTTNTDIIGMAIDYLWTDLGGEAVAFAELRELAATARRKGDE